MAGEGTARESSDFLGLWPPSGLGPPEVRLPAGAGPHRRRAAPPAPFPPPAEEQEQPQGTDHHQHLGLDCPRCRKAFGGGSWEGGETLPRQPPHAGRQPAAVRDG
eukprot:EG_transcript_47058